MQSSMRRRRGPAVAPRFRRPVLERLESRMLLAVGEIELGPSDNVALDQPRVAIELLEDVNLDPAVEDWQSVGPDIFNTFLLDTGANSVLAMATAVADMEEPPIDYRTEGQFVEFGVGGQHPMDISASYRFDYAGTNGIRNTYYDTRILSDPDQDFSAFGPWGLAGMPAMAERVTSFDMTGWSGGGVGLDDLYMKVAFGNEVPASAGHRYALSVDNRISFDPTDYVVSGEPPIWADIPFLTAIPTNLGIGKEGNFLLDTGAQISVISQRLGIEIGLDSNNDGVLDQRDAAFLSTETVGGVGGAISVPVFAIEELRVPVTQVSTGDEIELVWTDLQWLVLDIEVGENQPVLDGVFGSDLLTSGWFYAFFSPGMPDGYIDQVHLDFRDWGVHSGTPEPRTGTVYFDLNEAVDQVDIFGPGVRIRESDRSTEVIKGMTTDTYTIALSTLPAAPVQITVSADARTLISADGGATFASTLVLTFNDRQAQTITVGAVDDGVLEGPQTGIITNTVASTDVEYNNLDVRDVTVRILDGREVVTITADAAGEIKLDWIDVAEGGADALYWIRLAEAPANEIWVVVEDLATDQVKVNNPENSLGEGFENIWMFTSSNWSEPQLIELTAVDDLLREGPHQTQLIHSALDIITFEVVGQNVLPVHVADNDVEGVVITETGGSTDIAEGGADDTYAIALATVPAGAVQVTVTADSQTLVSKDGGATFASTAILTFVNTTPQTITVRAKNDTIAETTHVGIVSHAITGTIHDPEYAANLEIADVTATIADNDTVGLAIAADPDGQALITAIAVIEGSADVRYYMRLASAPKHDVTVFVSSDAGQVEVVDDANPLNAFVSFTPRNWNVPQAVRVTAIDDDVAEGADLDFIRHRLFSSDPQYQGTVLLEVNLADSLQVSQVVVNNRSAQRSVVTQLSVTFNAEVAIAAGAFQLLNRNSGASVATSFTTSLVNGKTKTTLTFLEGPSVQLRSSGNSLRDGNYQLTIDASKVTHQGLQLDGNANGTAGDNYVFGDQQIDKFFRFYGDTDGDGDVDGSDYGRFGLTFRKRLGEDGFNASLDNDGDGDVDGQDYGQFSLRFRKRLNFQ